MNIARSFTRKKKNREKSESGMRDEQKAEKEIEKGAP